MEKPLDIDRTSAPAAPGILPHGPEDRRPEPKLAGPKIRQDGAADAGLGAAEKALKEGFLCGVGEATSGLHNAGVEKMKEMRRCGPTELAWTNGGHIVEMLGSYKTQCALASPGSRLKVVVINDKKHVGIGP